MKKNVIITGAGGNLGRAAVNRFSNDGYTVIAVIEPGKQVQFPEGIEVFHVDLRDEQQVEKFVATVTQKFGTVDAALLLAGGYAGGGIAQTGTDQLRKMIGLNFDTAFFAARAIFLQMSTQSHGGRIVLVGSKSALDPEAAKGSLAYSLSKSMLFTFASMLNIEGAEKNIVTSVVVPSTIDTPENRTQMPKADFSKWVKPEKIAGVISFAVSQPAHPLVDPVFKVYGNPASDESAK